MLGNNVAKREYRVVIPVGAVDLLLNIEDFLTDDIKTLIEMFKPEAKRAVRHVAFVATTAIKKGVKKRGSVRGVQTRRINPAHSRRAYDNYRNSPPRRFPKKRHPGEPYIGKVGIINALSFEVDKVSLEAKAKIGFNGASAAKWGNRWQRADSVRVTPKMQRFFFKLNANAAVNKNVGPRARKGLKAAGKAFKKLVVPIPKVGTSIRNPAREVIGTYAAANEKFLAIRFDRRFKRNLKEKTKKLRINVT